MQKIKYIMLSTLFLSLGVFTSCNNASVETDVMVVGVNDENPLFNEIDILIDSLENKESTTIDNINFYTGKINDKKVVIAETPVGMSEAAMTTTIGIKHFKPKAVINEGTSGGHHLTVRNNHIVLGKDILDIASYKGDGSEPWTWKLLHSTMHSDEGLLEIASKVKYDYGLHTSGIIACSDVWNTSYDFITKLNTKFHEDCEEMEGYGVSTVCNNYHIPSLVIRVISNNLISGEEFDPTAGKNVQHYTLDVINAI